MRLFLLYRLWLLATTMVGLINLRKKDDDGRLFSVDLLVVSIRYYWYYVVLVLSKPETSGLVPSWQKSCTVCTRDEAKRIHEGATGSKLVKFALHAFWSLPGKLLVI